MDDETTNDAAQNVDAPNARTRREIAEIAVASGARRQRLIGDFISHRSPLFMRFARNLARRYSIPTSQEEDLAQMVREATFMLLAGGDWDRWLKSDRAFEADIFVTAGSKIRDEYESAAHTPVSGVTSKMRRGRKIADVRDRLRDALGEEPSQDQIIEAHNTEVTKRRSDAARQGMIIDASDFERVRNVSLDERDDHPNDMAEDILISTIEGRNLITQTIAVATARSAEDGHKLLGQVAKAWLGQALAEPPCILTNAEVADRVGISYEVSRQLVNQCREIAAEIAVTRYGYGSPA